MTFKNPFERETRAAVDLFNMTPFHDCVDGDYGNEDDDYSDNEHAIAWEMAGDEIEEPLPFEVAEALIKDHEQRQKRNN
jgi:hypothetical protein